MYALKCLFWLFVVFLLCGESLEVVSIEKERKQATDGSGIQPMLVGGTPVSASEFPFIASLYLADDECDMRTSHFCGGSIFDTTTAGKSWLLTTAHCLAGLRARIRAYNDEFDCDFQLYADVTRDDADDSSEVGFSTIELKWWKKHEGYSNDGLANDVAIAVADDQLTIGPVSLKTSSPCCESDEVLRAIGYGADYFGGILTETLEYVDLNFVEYDTCEAMMDDNAFPGDHLSAGMLCTYDLNEGPCHGDSGGPLLQGTTSDRPQVGVVAWGYGGCAAEGLPAVFTDVGYFYEWIMETQGAYNGNEDFLCDDGCAIPGLFFHDDHCDCAECEDEPFWNCDSCGDCPAECGDYEDCNTFECDDGCIIAANYLNDSYCDCTQCEDEPNWTCKTCPHCPSDCGDWVQCGVGHNATTNGPVFVCNDACVIPEWYYDDDWCDCGQCEDEPNWDCQSCAGGCPTQCGAYEYCYDTQTTTTETPTTTPATTCQRTHKKQKSYTFSSDEANCFANIDSKIKVTGWTQTIGPLALGQSVDLYTISGAEDCQLTDARCDGLVTATRRVDANGDFLEVAFARNEANGVRFTKFFVWFGTSQLPLKNNGQPTINPNAFFCKDHSPGVGSVNHSLQCRSPVADFSFEDAFHFIAHSLTTGCDPTDGGQSFCAAIFE